MSQAMSSLPSFLVFSIFFLISYIIADFFFDSAANDANHSLVSYLQNPYSKYLDAFFTLISILGEGYFYLPIIFLQFFCVSDKLEILIFFNFHCLNGFLNTFLKILYSSERPYMQFEDVVALSCEVSTGKPSGHSQSSLFFYIFLMEFLCKRLSFFKNQMLWRGFVEIVTITTIFLIGISRVYKGAHSFSQVLLGWVFSQSILCLWLFKRRSIYEFIRRSCNLKSRNSLQEIVIITLIMVFTMASTIMSFELRRFYTFFPQEDLDNLHTKCVKDLDTQQILSLTILNTTYIFVVFGIAYGFILTRGTFKPELFHKSMMETTWKIVLIRLFLLTGLILVILAVPFSLKSDEHTNVYILLILKNYVPYFIFGVMLIYLVPRLYKRCGVDLEGDLLKIESQEIENPEARKLELV